VVPARLATAKGERRVNTNNRTWASSDPAPSGIAYTARLRTGGSRTRLKKAAYSNAPRAPEDSEGGDLRTVAKKKAKKKATKKKKH